MQVLGSISVFVNFPDWNSGPMNVRMMLVLAVFGMRSQKTAQSKFLGGGFKEDDDNDWDTIAREFLCSELLFFSDDCDGPGVRRISQCWITISYIENSTMTPISACVLDLKETDRILLQNKTVLLVIDG